MCKSCEFFEILQSDWYFTILRMKRHGTRNLPSFYQTLFQAQRKGSGLGTRLGTRLLLPIAVFTADNEQIITVTLDLSVQACKNASLSLANVAWYV